MKFKLLDTVSIDLGPLFGKVSRISRSKYDVETMYTVDCNIIIPGSSTQLEMSITVPESMLELPPKNYT